MWGAEKTVVAGLAMFAAVTAGYQAALMVPTEILAEQHFESLQNLFPDLKLALLTGSLKAAEKREVLETIAKGEADLIIGTHALIQDGVDYARLGLIIIDGAGTVLVWGKGVFYGKKGTIQMYS